MQVGFTNVVTSGNLTNSNSHTAILNLNVGDKVYVTSRKLNSLSNASVTVSNAGGGIFSSRFMGYKIN